MVTVEDAVIVLLEGTFGHGIPGSTHDDIRCAFSDWRDGAQRITPEATAGRWDHKQGRQEEAPVTVRPTWSLAR